MSVFKPVSKWFFSLSRRVRTVIVALIGAVLLWGFVTPFYLEFLKILESVDVSGWWVVILCGIGLGIYARYGKNLLT